MVNQVSTVPWVASQCSVMQRVETVVVGESDVGIVVDKKCQHVISLLGNGIVKWCISFRVLQKPSNGYRHSDTNQRRSILDIVSS